MTTLDYAAAYETERHARRRRRAMLSLSTLVVFMLPIAFVGLLGLG
ncbi:hypothetical protein [Phenylobacterium sp.]|nr:hypothetical protein [Phenylobacterium sp.]